MENMEFMRTFAMKKVNLDSAICQNVFSVYDMFIIVAVLCLVGRQYLPASNRLISLFFFLMFCLSAILVLALNSPSVYIYEIHGPYKTNAKKYAKLTNEPKLFNLLWMRLSLSLLLPTLYLLKGFETVCFELLINHNWRKERRKKNCFLLPVWKKVRISKKRDHSNP